MKKTIAIVDDEAFMRSIIKKIVNHSDECKIVGEASNFTDAVEIARKFKPHLMTLDSCMPSMDCVEAVKEILQASPATCILMVSSMGDEKLMKKAVKAGAKGFIVKPFDEMEMKNAMHEACGK